MLFLIFTTLLIFHLINSFSFFETKSSPTKCGPGPALSVASGNLLNINSWGPTIDPTKSDTQEDDDQYCTLNKVF